MKSLLQIGRKMSIKFSIFFQTLANVGKKCGLQLSKLEGLDKEPRQQTKSWIALDQSQCLTKVHWFP